MPQFDFISKTISIQDLQQNAPSIIDEISRTQKEKIIIHNNALKAVVISAEMYEDYLRKTQVAPANSNTSTSHNNTFSNQSANHSSSEATTKQNSTLIVPKDIDAPPFEFDGSKSVKDIAREAFDYLEKYQLINNESLYNLGNNMYCHDIFGLSFPLLKRIHNRILLSTEIVVDNQIRYWKQIYTFNNKFYVLYSLLNDKQKYAFIEWLDRNYEIKQL